MSDSNPSPLAEAMRHAKEKAQSYVPEGSVIDRLHALLPDLLSARAAVMKKRAQLRDLDAATAEDPARPTDG